MPTCMCFLMFTSILNSRPVETTIQPARNKRPGSYPLGSRAGVGSVAGYGSEEEGKELGTEIPMSWGLRAVGARGRRGGRGRWWKRV